MIAQDIFIPSSGSLNTSQCIYIYSADPQDRDGVLTVASRCVAWVFAAHVASKPWWGHLRDPWKEAIITKLYLKCSFKIINKQRSARQLSGERHFPRRLAGWVLAQDRGRELPTSCPPTAHRWGHACILPLATQINAIWKFKLKTVINWGWWARSAGKSPCYSCRNLGWVPNTHS